jgi:hypothetical protein
MALRMTDLNAAVKTCTVEFEGESMDVGYNPNKVTLDLLDAIDAADSLAGVAVQLEGVIAWWDLLDENDQRLEPTMTVMRGLPLNLLLKVMDDISKDAKVGEGEG